MGYQMRFVTLLWLSGAPVSEQNTNLPSLVIARWARRAP